MRRLLRKLLPGDEVLIAGLGLGSAAVIVVACGSLWFLQARSEYSTLIDTRERTLNLLANTLAQSIETMLETGETSAARRLVVDTAQDADLSSCRVLFRDGGIVADSDAASISVQSLPAQFPSTGGAPPPPAQGRCVEMNVPGKGTAYLLITPHPLPELGWLGAPKAGGQVTVGVVAAASLAGLGIVYRFGRRRTRGLGTIDEALRDLAGGESEPAALEVSSTLGPAAQAWNGLLRELVQLRKQDLVRRTTGGSAAAARDDGLSGACDALWHGVVITDDAMRVRYANGAAAVFLTARREALIGSDLLKSIGDESAAATFRALSDESSRGRIVLESSLGPSRDDAVFRLSARRLRKAEGGGALLLIEDITQQRVADKARNAFVAHATHELRTPLTNIRLFVEALLDKPDTDTATRSKHLNVVNQEVRRLERIVGDMLSVSEIEAGTLKLGVDDVRLSSLFEELEADFRLPAQSKNITLKFALPPKLPVIVGDRDKIVLAISNLIGNALKYTPDGGAVTVTVSADRESLRIDVADTGIGISSEEADLVFERFYRSKDKRIDGITGSGLGLALARQVVRLHGGDITVTSELNKGSTFTLTLPGRAPVSLAA